MNYTEIFRVNPGNKVDLAKVDAGFKDKHGSNKEAQSEIEAYSQRLRELQYLLYA